jgi:hypothetical protein
MGADSSAALLEDDEVCLEMGREEQSKLQRILHCPSQMTGSGRRLSDYGQATERDNSKGCF